MLNGGIDDSGNKTEIISNYVVTDAHSIDMNVDDKDTNSSKENIDKCRAESFEEFSSTTTLHGVRYIGDQNSFKPRRLIWLVVVLFSASLFTIQVVDRVQYYLKSPITVNFKVNYNKSLTFPAVTICNQNLFRLSMVERDDLFNVIETLFGTPDPSDYYLDDLLSVEDMYTKLAHTKEDFIVRCRWGSIECFPENFTTTWTSHGVCYTFNKVDSMDESLTVDTSGVDYGLRLVLNTENYEKMAGPHATDGIKLIATDQSEIPNIDEVGIAISAGVHAFVGLKVISMNNLRSPYGQCGHRDLKTTERCTPESCFLECQTMYVNKTCQCRHFYMPDIDGTIPVCNTLQFFICLRETIEHFSDIKDEICDCPTACMFNIYESSVSYAVKSEWKTDFEKDVSSERLKRIRKTLTTAKAIHSKRDEDEADALSIWIEMAMFRLHELKVVMKANLDRLSRNFNAIKNDIDAVTIDATSDRDFLYDLQIYIVEKKFIRGYEAIEEDTFGVLCQSHKQFFNKVKTFLYNSRVLGEKMTLLLLDDLISTKLNIAKDAEDAFIRIVNAYDQGYSLIEYSPVNINNINETVLNAATPVHLLNSSIYFYSRNYSENEFLFGGDIDRIAMSLFRTKNLTYNILFNETSMEGTEELISLENEFSKGCKSFLDKKGIFYSEIIEKPAKVLSERKVNLATFYTVYDTEYESLIEKMKNLLINVQEVISETIPVIHEILTHAFFQNGIGYHGNFTKLNVAIQIIGFEMKSEFKKLETELEDIKNRISGLSETLPLFQNYLYDIWSHLLNFYEDNGPYDLLMNEYKLYRNISDFKLKIYRTFEEIEYSYKNLTHGIETYEAVQGVKALIELMDEYVESHRMDNAFYKQNLLEVNVYFQELRSEQIDQQKAYDEFALLCDIGGSMGLFIGGSAITFFEVIDFLLLNFVNKVFKRRR